MDLSLPGIDGWEATRLLKAAEETGQPTSWLSPPTPWPATGRRPCRRLRRLRYQARRPPPPLVGKLEALLGAAR